ncbi:hypothetical protein [Streptomyces sp. NPDC052036]|uniref:hypothetical protein n=1 Tax=unclassified Streptomyces TaxID=2593676 RepID=UPI0034454C65
MLAPALLGGLILAYSARASWGPAHVLAISSAALLVNVGLSFAVEPLGTVSPVAKYGANAALLTGVLALLTWARHRQCRHRSTTRTERAPGPGPAGRRPIWGPGQHHRQHQSTTTRALTAGCAGAA